jgi:hypothetical protein
MALAFYFSPPSLMTAAKYDECIARLKAAGAAHPRGRAYHACFGTSDSVAVFDVWTSQSEFEEFGKTLIPILQAIGVDAGQPMVAEVHNVIVPPAPRPRPPAKPAARKVAKKITQKIVKKTVKKAVKKVAKKSSKRRTAKKR